MTKAESEYQKAYRAWQRAANAAPKSRRTQYQDEKRRELRISELYRKVDAAREALKMERAE